MEKPEWVFTFQENPAGSRMAEGKVYGATLVKRICGETFFLRQRKGDLREIDRLRQKVIAPSRLVQPWLEFL